MRAIFRTLLYLTLSLAALFNSAWAVESVSGDLNVEVSDVFSNPVYVRAGRDARLTAYVYSFEDSGRNVSVKLELPGGMKLISKEAEQNVSILPGNANKKAVSWTVRPSVPGELEYSIKISDSQKSKVCNFALNVWEARNVAQMEYPPKPAKVDTGDYIVGCFRCPLWNDAPDALPGAWSWTEREYKRFADRMPALGKYNEDSSEVADWELKWAAEHGISFFVDCWFRKKGNAGNPEVEGWLDHWVKRMCSLETRYRGSVKFAIAWENSNPAADGIANAADFAENLVPYWIKTYFCQPNYMKVDCKPLFVLYNPAEFVKQAGGLENASAAMKKMREKVLEAGFPGLYVIAVHNEGSKGMYSGIDYSDMSYLKTALGADAITAYNVPTFVYGLGVGAYTPAVKIVENQKAAWENLREISKLPVHPVVSMGYDARPWGADTDSAGWVLPPDDYFKVLLNAKSFAVEESSASGAPKIVMLDNWNEYAEGHYIAPTHKYGFRYLDSVRKAFQKGFSPHVDLVPEDIGGLSGAAR